MLTLSDSYYKSHKYINCRLEFSRVGIHSPKKKNKKKSFLTLLSQEKITVLFLVILLLEANRVFCLLTQ